MVFSSMIFLWLFLPVVLFLYFLSGVKYRNLILLVASLVFYAWGEPKYIVLMLISILMNYVFGLLIDRYRKYAKLWLAVAVLANLLLLGYFKYFNFFVNILNRAFGAEVMEFRDILLPIGISFYTFQILSYVVDLYRKEIKVQKNPINLALYIALFPQLIAGPIVRYSDVAEELEHRETSLELFSSGVRKFAYGMGKKVLIANAMASVVDTVLVNEIAALNTPLAWLAMICYALQIYFDFSGYSDMAIGLGRMFGFHFPENFNLPYLSQSVTEFWRRWHISLSTWFKEYLYIPLGGNRKGRLRTYINLLIVFLATGLWHGASYNFVVWGMYYGILLVIEKLFLKKVLDKNKFKVLNYVYMFIVTLVGWAFFRAETLPVAAELITKMFSFDFSLTYVLTPMIMNARIIIIIIAGIVFAGPGQAVWKKLWGLDSADKHSIKEEVVERKISLIRWVEVITIVLILVLSIVELTASTYNPFIYFRF